MINNFVIIEGQLFCDNKKVVCNGETLKGDFVALLFDGGYCFLKSNTQTIDDVINDYIECTGKNDFNVKIINLAL